MGEDHKNRQIIDGSEMDHRKPFHPRFYTPIIIGGSITGLIAGFLLGSLGTFFYFKLTVDEKAFGFLYGLGIEMLAVGAFGACIGGAVGGMAAHALALSRLYKYSLHIIVSTLFVIACVTALILYPPW